MNVNKWKSPLSKSDRPHNMLMLSQVDISHVLSWDFTSINGVKTEMHISRVDLFHIDSLIWIYSKKF